MKSEKLHASAGIGGTNLENHLSSFGATGSACDLPLATSRFEGEDGQFSVFLVLTAQPKWSHFKTSELKFQNIQYKNARQERCCVSK